jgi:hypothetical protein
MTDGVALSSDECCTRSETMVSLSTLARYELDEAIVHSDDQMFGSSGSQLSVMGMVGNLTCG